MTFPFSCPGWGCREVTQTWGVCCPDCWAYHEVIVDRLPSLWRAAHAVVLTPRYPQARERVTGGAPTSRPPLNLGGLDVLRGTVITVLAWASVLAVRRDLVPPPAFGLRPWPVLLDLGVDLVCSTSFDLADTPLGSTLYNDLYRCRRSLERLTYSGNQPPQRIPHPCPACGRATIVDCAGGHHFACLTCGNRWGQAAWTFRDGRQNRQSRNDHSAKAPPLCVESERHVPPWQAQRASLPRARSGLDRASRGATL